jgi:hypothetical protein
MSHNKRRPPPPASPEQVQQVLAEGRHMVARIDQALEAGRRYFDANGIDHRRAAEVFRRRFGVAGAAHFKAECARVMAAIDRSAERALERFTVPPPPGGGSRRPRNLV